MLLMKDAMHYICLLEVKDFGESSIYQSVWPLFMKDVIYFAETNLWHYIADINSSGDCFIQDQSHHGNFLILPANDYLSYLSKTDFAFLFTKFANINIWCNIP